MFGNGGVNGGFDAGIGDEEPVVTHVLSLGSLCYAAHFLQQHQMRPYAGPFDYIFSDPQMVSHCIEDGFSAFLDRSQYFLIEGKVTGHLLYSDMIDHRTIFNHHSPLLDRDHAHFARCVERFTTIIGGRGRKLLLLVSKKPLDPAAIDALFRVVTHHSREFELLAVELNVAVSGERSTVLIASKADPSTASMVRLFVQHCRAGHTGLAFNDPLDAAVFEALLLGGKWPRTFKLAQDPLPPKNEQRARSVHRRVRPLVLKQAAKAAGCTGWQPMGVSVGMSSESSLQS